MPLSALSALNINSILPEKLQKAKLQVLKSNGSPKGEEIEVLLDRKSVV